MLGFFMFFFLNFCGFVLYFMETFYTQDLMKTCWLFLGDLQGLYIRLYLMIIYFELYSHMPDLLTLKKF